MLHVGVRFYLVLFFVAAQEHKLRVDYIIFITSHCSSVDSGIAGEAIKGTDGNNVTFHTVVAMLHYSIFWGHRRILLFLFFVAAQEHKLRVDYFILIQATAAVVL
jgi:hypothetical protein